MKHVGYSLCEFVSFSEKQSDVSVGGSCQQGRMLILSQTGIRSKLPLHFCLLVQCFLSSGLAIHLK